MQYIEDHIASGLECRFNSFRAVKALIKQAANYAASIDQTSCCSCTRDFYADIYGKCNWCENQCVAGSWITFYMERIAYYADLHERSPDSRNYETKVTSDLTLITTRMFMFQDQLGVGVHTALDVLDLVAQKNSTGYKLNQPPQ